jgi:hypothetical protein
LRRGSIEAHDVALAAMPGVTHLTHTTGAIVAGRRRLIGRPGMSRDC